MPSKKKNPVRRIVVGTLRALHLKDPLKSALKSSSRQINALGKTKQCYICGHTFSHFLKWDGYSPEWRKPLMGVGSCTDDFGCPFCGSNDRERHLFLYFDRLKLWPKNTDNVLHFAPELNLFQKIAECNPQEYIKADFNPELYARKGVPGVRSVNLMEISFDDNHFDFLICNHVLEHVPDLKRGLTEIYRVLKHGGIAILQTPFSRLLHHHFEDPGISGEELCEHFHGQNDHVRTVSGRQFFKDMEEIGFRLEIAKHSDIITPEETKRYGVNPEEDLIRVVKP
jgi:SAM-dependent methyltransferase